MSIAYYHRDCGNLLVFFNKDTPLQPGDILKAGDWQYPNGNLVGVAGDTVPRLVCSRCNREWSFGSQSLTPELPKTP